MCCCLLGPAAYQYERECLSFALHYGAGTMSVAVVLQACRHTSVVIAYAGTRPECAPAELGFAASVATGKNVGAAPSVRTRMSAAETRCRVWGSRVVHETGGRLSDRQRPGR
jgi:hypothetical protein